MAQGNCYILVPNSEKNNNVPDKLKNKWKFREPVVDENGEPTGEFIDVHPSWLGAANRFRKKFGVIRNLNYKGADFLLVELELSFIDGEVDAVAGLQKNKPGEEAYYQILTNTEAKDFLRWVNSDGQDGVDLFS